MGGKCRQNGVSSSVSYLSARTLELNETGGVGTLSTMLKEERADCRVLGISVWQKAPVSVPELVPREPVRPRERQRCGRQLVSFAAATCADRNLNARLAESRQLEGVVVRFAHGVIGGECAILEVGSDIAGRAGGRGREGGVLLPFSVSGFPLLGII